MQDGIQRGRVIAWHQQPTYQRCQIVGDVAGQIASAVDQLIELGRTPWRSDPVEILTSELYPLCAALKWIGRRGAKVLAEKEYGIAGRPAWLWGVHSRVRRVPLGDVLILAAWNYPVFLAGAQAAQALAAGNSVQIKPAPGCEEVTAAMIDCFYHAGVPRDALAQLNSDTDTATAAIDAGVDLIILTGSAATGKKVMQRAAETMTPTIMELSGCDAVVIHPLADMDRAARAIAFGLQLSSGATCIAPRRVIAEPTAADELCELIEFHLKDVSIATVHPSARKDAARLVTETIQSGAIDVMGRFDPEKLLSDGSMYPMLLDQVNLEHVITCSDVFAPVTSMIRVDDISESIGIINQCPYRLAASVFAPDDIANAVCEHIAEKLQVGSIAINDLIIPTADPRVPFGGRGKSGFGVTRGEEGLIAMTAAQVIGHHHGNFLLHLRPRDDLDFQTLKAALVTTHAKSWKERLASIRTLVGKG